MALDGSKARYTLHFNKGEFPLVDAFWSLTMYNLPQQLLVKNPINRYLINSPMLPDLKARARRWPHHLHPIRFTRRGQRI